METTPYPPRHHLPADLAAGLRAARLRRSLGLRQAARKAGIGHGYLSLLEHGERCPSRAVAVDLIAALDLDGPLAAWLLEVARPDAGRSRLAVSSRLNTGPPTPVENWVPVESAGCAALSGQPHAMTTRLRKPVKVGKSVGAAFDDFDLVDDPFGVSVGGWLLEVGQQLLAPLS
jgi:transcriptional regulator with XRE-family HTH domain